VDVPDSSKGRVNGQTDGWMGEEVSRVTDRKASGAMDGKASRATDGKVSRRVGRALVPLTVGSALHYYGTGV
jgi:hypothetical protein